MVGVAARLHTPVYLQHRSAGGLPALVYLLATSDSTTISHYSPEEQYHRGSLTLSVYNALNAEASCYTLSP
jgi:hypothetical protein